MHTASSEARLQQALDDITRLLERHRVLDTLTQRLEGPKKDLLEELQHRQNLAELHARVRQLHPADLAHVLERLPLAVRLVVWHQVEARQRAEVLLEVSDPVRESLIAETPHADLVASLKLLDAEDLSYLPGTIPEDALREVWGALDAGERSWIQASMRYDRETVGALMSPEVVFARDQQTVGDALTTLRTLGALPPQTDRIFVVDSRPPSWAWLSPWPSIASDATLPRARACSSPSRPMGWGSFCSSAWRGCFWCEPVFSPSVFSLRSSVYGLQSSGLVPGCRPASLTLRSPGTTISRPKTEDRRPKTEDRATGYRLREDLP